MRPSESAFRIRELVRLDRLNHSREDAKSLEGTFVTRPEHNVLISEFNSVKLAFGSFKSSIVGIAIGAGLGGGLITGLILKFIGQI